MLLNQKEIDLKLSMLDGWFFSDMKISRKLEFSTFTQSVQFFNAVASIAEKLNHHPDFFNCYNNCEIAINTHDLGGLTQLDFNFAKAVNDWLEANSLV